VCLLFNCFINIGYAQNRYTLPQVTPLSPNAASLGKYGEIPVSLNNGMANISVPLFEVKIGSFVLPVTLTYHNNGLKTNEIPSYVGLGWDIPSFGVINLQQRGNYDFDNDGMFYAPIPSQQKLQAFQQGQMSPQQKSDYLEAVMLGNYDTEYDLYTYSFLGQAGSFYMDANQNVISVPKTNLKITKEFHGFTIVDERGNQYQFGLGESSEYTTIPEDVYTVRKRFNGTSSYLLYQIITAENRIISFGYTDYPFNYHITNQYATVYNRPKVYPECPDDNFVTNISNVKVENALLTNIRFDGGRIDFRLSANSREDIKNFTTPVANVPYLDRVQLIDDKGTVVNDFALMHSYFHTSARLRLDGISKTAANNVSENWQFEYYDEGDIPGIYLGARDHWGFSGGGNGIPAADYSLFVGGWSNERLPMGMVSRNSNSASKNGMLKTITYPTGGKSVLTYEPNKIKYKTYHEITANPFLSYGFNPANYIEPVYIEAATSDNQPTISGSFTLTGPALVTINANKEYDPSNFIYSAVTLCQSPGGADIIQQQIGYVCRFGGCHAEKQIELEPGTYYYTLNRNTDENFPNDRGSANLIISYIPEEFPTPVPYQVGGFRIASIENISNTGSSTKKRYEYTDLNGSLNFRNIPFYISRTNMKINIPAGNGIYLCEPCNQEIKIHDESVVPLPGNPVEYAHVTEYNDDAGSNGKIEYTYSYTESLSEGGGSPYIVPFLATWSGGQLKNKKIFKSIPNPNGTGYIYDLVEEDGFEFESTPPASVVRGFKAEYFTYCTKEGPGYREFGLTPENYQTERFSPKASTKTLYDNFGNITQTSVNTYASTAHTLPTEVSGTNSRNEEVKQLASYSFEYATGNYADGASLGIKALIDKNILAPVENLVVKKISGADYVVSGKLMIYKSNSATLEKVYELAIKTPVLLSNITRSFINSSGQFIKDSRYEERATINLYDNYNNVLQQQYANNVVQSYIYDYNSMYLVAAVTNADAASIAYTSFESSGGGNWNVSGAPISTAFTGHQGYWLNVGNITKSGLLASKTYLVTYWTTDNAPCPISGTLNTPRLLKETRGWKCFEHTISGVTQIVIPESNAVIDELRLCPEGAMMISYTYDPFVGITHQNDVANNVTYYEYDAFRRLRLIRDIDRNILKQFDYQYQANETDGANWVKTGNTRCKPCSTNVNYTINVRQYEERDNNPNSQGYLSTRWIDDSWAGNCTITADWQNTATPTRCKKVPNLNQFTGEVEQEQIDRNPCSNTSNQTRWVVTGINCTACVPPGFWLPTGNTRCLLDQYNQNTGYVEQEESKKTLLCGTETRWVNIGFHPETCMPPCYYCQNPSEGEKCVGTICEAGIKVYTNSYQQGQWIYCVYHYEFSDGTWSENYTEQSENWCIMEN
jgi:YD repeat-containing protein